MSSHHVKALRLIADGAEKINIKIPASGKVAEHLFYKFNNFGATVVLTYDSLRWEERVKKEVEGWRENDAAAFEQMEGNFRDRGPEFEERVGQYVEQYARETMLRRNLLMTALTQFARLYCHNLEAYTRQMDKLVNWAWEDAQELGVITIGRDTYSDKNGWSQPDGPSVEEILGEDPEDEDE